MMAGAVEEFCICEGVEKKDPKKWLKRISGVLGIEIWLGLNGDSLCLG